MKKLTITAVFVVALTTPAFAGEIPTIGAPQPQATSSPEVQISLGDIPSGGLMGQIPSGGFTGDIPTDGLSAVLSVIRFLV